MLAALHGILIGNTKYTLNFFASVVVGVVCNVCSFFLFSKVHTTSQLTDADKVGTTYQLVLQGRLVHQAVEGLNRTDIGKQTQLLTHSQETLLRANLSGWVVIELRVTNAGKEHSISIHTGLESLLGEGIANLVNSMGTTKSLLVRNLVSELLGYSTHNGYALLHNLWSDAITGQNCNLKLHILVLLYLTS